MLFRPRAVIDSRHQMSHPGVATVYAHSEYGNLRKHGAVDRYCSAGSTMLPLRRPGREIEYSMIIRGRGIYFSIMGNARLGILWKRVKCKGIFKARIIKALNERERLNKCEVT